MLSVNLLKSQLKDKDYKIGFKNSAEGCLGGSSG